MLSLLVLIKGSCWFQEAAWLELPNILFLIKPVPLGRASELPFRIECLWAKSLEPLFWVCAQLKGAADDLGLGSPTVDVVSYR